MSSFTKVVWSEGLFLRPQHFQQQERYLERYIEIRSQGLRSHGWGCIELALETDLLSVGKVGLRRAVGVFPDGTPFRLPDDHPLPAPLEISSQLRDQVIYLATPLRTAAALDAARDGGTDGAVRHSVSQFEARDSSAASAATAVVETAELRTRLMPASELGEGFAQIPIAQVVEIRADRQVVLDQRFIPTVLDARAAPRLATFISELVGLLHQRGEALAARATGAGRAATSELADFLMLQAINRYEPVVAHLADAAPHPEDLYRICLAAAGELSTFTTTAKRPPALGPYRHERLRESFEPVMAAIRAALSAVLEQSAIPIPIEAKKFGIHVAVVPDRALFGTAVFILAARADLPAEELRRRFPAQVKIGPVEKIRDLVNLQLPGLAVAPLPVAPRQIPYHAGFVYFELDQTHELWAQLKGSGGIAMHAAGEFPGLALELWAVRG
jgi:type VI secretion system protein ImpJ